MSATERLAELDQMPAATLCKRTADCLDALAAAMNTETTLMREGKFREASPVTSRKIELAQDYVALVRAVQRQTARLLKEAPEEVKALRRGHEKLATQMAENLRVIATARTVTEGLLQDVARTAGQGQRAATYGAGGGVPSGSELARGIAVNRAL